jgi:hypothetical protein
VGAEVYDGETNCIALGVSLSITLGEISGKVNPGVNMFISGVDVFLIYCCKFNVIFAIVVILLSFNGNANIVGLII